ncbi:hypothetical protein OH77DRAFT_1430404, partial [Trametes cingulata]
MVIGAAVGIDLSALRRAGQAYIYRAKTSGNGSEVIFDNASPPSLDAEHILAITMDAFFTIAPPVPVEVPADIPVDNDDPGTGGNHGSCTIA